MNIEQKSEKFNMEEFRSEFKSEIETYASRMFNVDHREYETGEEYSKAQDKISDTLMEKVVPLIVSALKSANNKADVIDFIDKTFENISNEYPFEEGQNPLSIYALSVFYKKIILDLLKHSSC